GHLIERSVHASAQREKPEEQNETDDRAGNQRQEEMRDELAQPLKKQDLNEAGDHGRTILSGFYPERTADVSVAYPAAVLEFPQHRRHEHETHGNTARGTYHLARG